MKFEISDTRSLIQTLRVIEEETTKFLEGDARSYKSLTTNVIEFTNDIHLDYRACEAIKRTYTMFKGIINGNGHTITTESRRLTSLFTSLYFATVKDLTIYNLDGSAGLILAIDGNESVVENVIVTGDVKVTDISGFLFTVSYLCEFSECHVELNLTGYPSLEDGKEGDKSGMQEYIGYFSGSDSKSLFSMCSITGSSSVDRCIGGFVGSASGTAFYECKVENLTLRADREIGGFVSECRGDVSIVDSSIANLNVNGTVYLGLVAARAHAHLHLDNLVIKSSTIKPRLTNASYVGGVASEVKHLTCENVEMEKVYIESNFITAGLTPNLDKAILLNSSFDIQMVSLGNKHVEANNYKLVRDRYAGISGGRIEIEEQDLNVNVDITIVAPGGKIKPFKEEWY